MADPFGDRFLDASLVRLLSRFSDVSSGLLQFPLHLLCAALDLLARAAGYFTHLLLRLASDVFRRALDLIAIHDAPVGAEQMPRNGNKIVNYAGGEDSARLITT